MDNTIEKLLQNCKTDKNAAIELLNMFKNNMYAEARIYTADLDRAKDIVLKAFSSAYPNLPSVGPNNLEQELNKYVENESIKRAIPLDQSETLYISDDEIPDSRIQVPSDTAKVKNQLLSILKLLSPSERIVAVLKYRNQYTADEIANKLDSTENNVNSLLSDAKQKINKAGVPLGAVFAFINKLYPFYTEPVIEEKEPVLEIENKEEQVEQMDDQMNEQDLFDTSVHELKTLFNTKTLSTKQIVDVDLDDSEDQESEHTIENTLEIKAITTETINNAPVTSKVLISSQIQGNSDDGEINDPKQKDIKIWLKRGLIIIGLAAIAFLGGIAVSSIMNKTRKPVDDSELTPVETQTAEPQANETDNDQQSNEETSPNNSPTPEAVQETEEPIRGIGQAYIMVTDLTIRTGPGVGYSQNGFAEPEKTYDVFELTQADGYTWYRIDESNWVADYQGQFVRYTPAE